MPHSVRLTPLNADGVERLLVVAVAEATEENVMPPVDEPPGWSTTRQDAFRQFYRRHREVMHEVAVADRTVGMIRLTPTTDDGVAETGMWPGSSARGKGIGADAVRAVLDHATNQGWKTVVADTHRTTSRSSVRLLAAKQPCLIRVMRCSRLFCFRGFFLVDTEVIEITLHDWMSGWHFPGST